MRKILSYSGLVALLLLLLTTLYFGLEYRFLANSLHSHGIVESVQIDTQTYIVDKGMVSGASGHIRGLFALSALRLAYIKILTERAPLLGLEGTDPNALRSNTELLRETTERLAMAQDTERDAQLVRTSLYPLTFLASLATLESNRKTFIHSGSADDFEIYSQALFRAIQDGTKDAETLGQAFLYETRGHWDTRSTNFKDTFTLSHPTSTHSISWDSRFPGFSGTITPISIYESINSIPIALNKVRYQYEARRLCSVGLFFLCPDLLKPTFPEMPYVPDEATNIDIQRQVRTILRATAPTTSNDSSYAPIQLEKSACLASLPPPYKFETAVLLKKNFDLLHYLDNMYFIPTANVNGPVPNFLSDAYRIHYIKINPLVFYLCPFLLSDISDAQMTLKTLAIAKAYPDILNSHRERLISQLPTSAKNVRLYLQEALDKLDTDSFPPSYIESIMSATLMFNQKSAGLDALVGQIIYISERDLALSKNGVPFDLSAKTLFLTRTAASSLFLIHQISALSPLVPPSSNDTKKLYASYVPLSVVLLGISKSTLIDDILRMNSLEKGQM